MYIYYEWTYILYSDEKRVILSVLQRVKLSIFRRECTTSPFGSWAKLYYTNCHYYATQRRLAKEFSEKCRIISHLLYLLSSFVGERMNMCLNFGYVHVCFRVMCMFVLDVSYALYVLCDSPFNGLYFW